MAKVEIEISAEDLTDEELKSELSCRGYLVFKDNESLTDHLTDNEILEEYSYRSLKPKVSEIDNYDLMDELTSRGFRDFQPNETDDVDLEKIVQLHRCGDPRWEKLALNFLYDLANKVV